MVYGRVLTARFITTRRFGRRAQRGKRNKSRRKIMIMKKSRIKSMSKIRIERKT